MASKKHSELIDSTTQKQHKPIDKPHKPHKHHQAQPSPPVPLPSDIRLEACVRLCRLPLPTCKDLYQGALGTTAHARSVGNLTGALRCDVTPPSLILRRIYITRPRSYSRLARSWLRRRGCLADVICEISAAGVCAYLGERVSAERDRRSP